ncbi:MAG: helix-turn-helix transcriptional regulator [Oscillospiraceae bacterium]|nr:helix-turn-helix transcriptional regulator [Oscillospiraceae bacterium]
MDDEKLKVRIGENIAAYRKRAGLTQAGLAEQLNYSDKAVSKWERGESCPDIPTVIAIADKLGTTVGALLSDPNELPANSGSRVEKTMEKVVEKALKRKANKKTILGLSSILVWFVALLIYVVVSSIGLSRSWLAFFYAIPADCIVMLSLLSAWHDFRWNRALISGIMWGSLVSIFATLLVIWDINVWKIFLLGIPGQAAILLWFKLFRPVTEDAE